MGDGDPNMQQKMTGGKITKVQLYDCPFCGGKKAVGILYGYPDPEALQMWKDKKIELGGCIVSGKMPNRSCPECHKEWLAKKGEGSVYEEEYFMPPIPPAQDEEIPF